MFEALKRKIPFFEKVDTSIGHYLFRLVVLYFILYLCSMSPVANAFRRCGTSFLMNPRREILRRGMWTNNEALNPTANIDTDPVRVKQEIDDYNKSQLQALQMFDLMFKVQLNKAKDDEELKESRRLIKSLHYGRMPPTIHNEFTVPPILRNRDKRLVDLAHSVLYRGFLNAQCHPWMLGWTWICGDDGVEHDDTYHIKRWNSLWRWKVVEKYPEQFKKVGAIIMADPDREEAMITEYHRDLRTHFSNAPSFPTSTPPTLGPTHVALGFNDLQVLLSDAGSTAPIKPVRFIGYDRSTYSVAKTLVLAHMLRSTAGVQPHHIVEAWYSSTWSYETLMFFRSSCMALLSGEGLPDTTAPPTERNEIQRYIEHWAYHAVPMTDTDVAVRWFFESVPSGRVYTQTCSFHRPQDRISLLKYFMTGEFGPHCFGDASPSQSERVASLAMFSVPDGSPRDNISDQDRVSNTILMQDILNELDVNGNGAISILEAMYNIEVRQIRLLQEGVQSEQVQLDLRYGNVQPLRRSDSKILHEIRDWEADSMSWSNLADYFLPDQFHELAQYWSTDTTKHYGYTMNWSLTCYGAQLCDYDLAEERKKILLDAIETAVQNIKASGSDKIVTAPSFEHTEDVAWEYLGRQLSSTWVKYFKNEAQSVTQESGTRLILQDEMQLRSPISRTSLSIYMSWQYR
jgi:hypothetical protein